MGTGGSRGCLCYSVIPVNHAVVLVQSQSSIVSAQVPHASHTINIIMNFNAKKFKSFEEGVEKITHLHDFKVCLTDI